LTFFIELKDMILLQASMHTLRCKSTYVNIISTGQDKYCST